MKLGPQILQHLKEIRRHIRNHNYERSPAGVLFPQMGAICSPQFTEWVNDDIENAGYWDNLVCDQGLNYLINAGLLGVSPVTTYTLALHSGASAPANTWTGANYASNATEITATGPEGYSQPVRQAWTGVLDAVPSNTRADNSASPAVVTIVTASSLNILGAALIGGDNIRGGTSGTLIGAVKYGSTRVLGNADSYNIQYQFDLNTP